MLQMNEKIFNIGKFYRFNFSGFWSKSWFVSLLFIPCEESISTPWLLRGPETNKVKFISCFESNCK